VLDDIRNVGITKLIGYLPLQTIRDNQTNEHQLIAEVEERGLTTFLLSEDECHVGSGALYVADLLALQKFLNDSRQKSILKLHNWPSDASMFVHAVSTRRAPPGGLFDLVALTFCDKRPEYQYRNAMAEVSQVSNIEKSYE